MNKKEIRLAKEMEKDFFDKLTAIEYWAEHHQTAISSVKKIIFHPSLYAKLLANINFIKRFSCQNNTFNIKGKTAQISIPIELHSYMPMFSYVFLVYEGV
jgi:hypothetical protein